MKENKEYYIFTFGAGQRYAGRYVKIYGSCEETRRKMINKYGLDWAFQYSAERWREAVEQAKGRYRIETELEVIE